MGSTTQQLNVGINADASGLVRATTQASTALAGLQTDLSKLDAKRVDFTPEFHLDQINQNIGMVRTALQKLDAQRADPNVTMDSAQFLTQQRKLFNELRRLEREKVDIEVGLNVNQTMLSRFQTTVDGLAATGLGGGIGNLTTGLSGAAGALTRFGGAAGGAAGPIAAVGVAIGGMVYAGAKLGLMAADVETLRLQLDTLTGGGGGPLLADLQAFAASTPFELDEVTGAARRLIVAGEDLQDLPSTLTDLGDAAAATGTPLEQIAGIFAQMETKGKVTFEEMQQLAEAGIPVWSALADSMGLTVAEVQDLATEGKLGASAIKELQGALGDQFGGAMELQAASLNGQLSTLNDNIKQTGENLGTFTLPALTKATATLNLLATAARLASEDLAEFGAKGNAGIEAMMDAFGLPEWADPFGDPIRSAEHFSDTVGGLGDALADAIRGPQLGDAVIGMFDQAEAAAEGALSGMRVDAVVEVNTRLNFLIGQDDLMDEIRELTADGVTLPARLKLTRAGIGGLTDDAKDLLGNVSTIFSNEVQAALDRGMSPEQIAGVLNRTQAMLRPILIDAGLRPGAADRVLAKLAGEAAGGVTVPVDANTKPAEGAVGSFVQRRTGKTIYVDASTGAAQGAINEITKPEWKTVYVQIVRTFQDILPGGSGGGSSDERSTNERSAPGAVTGRTRELAPKQTPVAVYLDGAEIADHLELKANRLATVGSVRRLP